MSEGLFTPKQIEKSVKEVGEMLGAEGYPHIFIVDKKTGSFAMSEAGDGASILRVLGSAVAMTARNLGMKPKELLKILREGLKDNGVQVHGKEYVVK